MNNHASKIVTEDLSNQRTALTQGRIVLSICYNSFTCVKNCLVIFASV